MSCRDRLVAALGDDPRVVGIARVASATTAEHVIVVSTWDGRDALGARLPEFAAAWLGDDAPLTAPIDDDDPATAIDALAADGARVRLEVRRIGDLKPSARGESAEALLDPKGLIAQWEAWSRGRRRPVPAPELAPERVDLARRRLVLDVDALVRELAGPLAPGRQVVGTDGQARSLRQRTGELLRGRLSAIAGDAPELRGRVALALSPIPHPASGIRVVGTGPETREQFLSIADAEGFLGDRPLLEAAEETLRAHAGRAPVFVEGFALATFDQVEARYALGDAVGGCQPPLVPGVYVGVGVTPADDLEFWAAPCVAEPGAGYACIADTGERQVRARTVGRDALFAALTDAVAAAHDALSPLLRRARGAHRETLEDPAAALRPLHLPASFVAAAGLHGALAPGVNRLFAALALARAAGDMDPVVGRKLALAAGRCLLAAPEDDTAACG